MTQQGRLIGEHVDEITIFLNKGDDSGARSLYVALQASGRRFQATTKVPDYLATDDVVGAVGLMVFDVERGSCAAWEFVPVLRAALETIAESPF